MNDISSEPFNELGIKSSATASEIRQAYLTLVRQFPPDKNPERFRQIHAAYQSLLTPIHQAQSLVASCLKEPDLNAMIESASRDFARLPHLALLALGDEQ